MTDRPRWHRRHWLVVDVAMAAIFVALDTVGTLGGTSWWPAKPDALAWSLLGLQALAVGTLVVRRIAPITVVAVLTAFTLALTLLVSPGGALTPAHGGNVWAPFGTTVAAYGPLFYQRRCDQRARRAALFALAALTLVVMRPWDASVGTMTVGLLRTAVGPLLALYIDARHRLVLALTERAERAEREQHLLARQARAEERARLAGEMHDIVTHRVSLMVLQAGAMQVTATDERTRRAAEELRSSGCQALDELRDLVGILRAEPEGDLSPSVEGIPTLVAESTAVGIPTELVEEGAPALASPVVGRTAYRVVREGLTNVRKHASGARVTVRVDYGETRVRVAVTNTRPSAPPGSGPTAALAGTGSGLGIAQLRQRIEVVHGTLRAGHTPDGGFEVEAILPAYVPTAETVG
ncbi:two-component sensor histidine kinase [Streptacidiphilus pinicola]|uniref:histidine kinase n=1 Tax=Streptacidiphilus pinicola TaxID=2219663 RepID=A0A2X0J3H5_9ACTN|nr:histidine kinase [Streptacidiphilus pinicola]RAG81938.1 two-component sensor histidine kinase [Streptacidiphilus pinicola]